MLFFWYRKVIDQHISNKIAFWYAPFIFLAMQQMVNGACLLNILIGINIAALSVGKGFSNIAHR